MPYDSEAAAVLEMWREVEHQLNVVTRESEEAARLLDDWARLRTEYERLVELASRYRRPLPPPWPES